jgi:hypothetical protein
MCASFCCHVNEHHRVVYVHCHVDHCRVSVTAISYGAIQSAFISVLLSQGFLEVLSNALEAYIYHRAFHVLSTV